MKKDKMIKNTCGAISLMLALLVVPFYAVAGILGKQADISLH